MESDGEPDAPAKDAVPRLELRVYGSNECSHVGLHTTATGFRLSDIDLADYLASEYGVSRHQIRGAGGRHSQRLTMEISGGTPESRRSLVLAGVQAALGFHVVCRPDVRQVVAIRVGVKAPCITPGRGSPPRINNGANCWEGHDVPLRVVASALSDISGSIFVDESGLADGYDVSLSRDDGMPWDSDAEIDCLRAQTGLEFVRVAREVRIVDVVWDEDESSPKWSKRAATPLGRE